MPDKLNICVFCGSSFGLNPAYVEATIALGKLIARKNYRLIYGGGNRGLMGALADTVLDAGGEVIGVIPKALFERERAHQKLTELRVVGSMHERKAMMEQLSNGFIALPGGLGTFDEFIEIITWNQLGFIDKPAGILNVAGYYNILISQLDLSVKEEFVSKEIRNKIIVETDAEILLNKVLEPR
jgi:hypothetical protein